MFGFFKKKKKAESSFSITPTPNGLDDTYLFDFKNLQSGFNSSGNGVFMTQMDPMVPMGMGTVSGTPGDHTSANPSADSLTPPKRISIKPIHVLEELEKIPTPWSLINLDDKITILKEKEKLITQHYAKREVTALIERLQNRKKYTDPENKKFFDSYQNTTDEAIDKLLKKYDLVMKTSDIFVPEFPDDAVLAMKNYTDFSMKICDKKPVFYVIAEESKFRKAYEKRDPILLAQSPFGFYWQILGAWDKEMLLLHEL